MNIRSVVRAAIMAASLISCRPLGNTAPSLPAWDPSKQVLHTCELNGDIFVYGAPFPSGTRIRTAVSPEKILKDQIIMVPVESFQMDRGPWKKGEIGSFQLTIPAEKLRAVCPEPSWKVKLRK